MKKQIRKRMYIVGIFTIILISIICIITANYVIKKQAFNNLQLYIDTLIEEELTTRDAIINQSFPTQIRVTLIDIDGNVLYDSEINAAIMQNHIDREEVKQAIEEGDGRSIRTSDTMSKSTYYFAEKTNNNTILRVAIESSSIWSVVLNALPWLIMSLVIVILLGFWISEFLTKQIIHPIVELADNIDNIEEKKTYEELQPIVNKLIRQNTVRRDFTANVSHELKTPLTAISGYSELIENGIAKPDDIKEFAHKIGTESSRLLTLINDILNISHLESSTDDIKEIVNLTILANECCDNLKLEADKKNVNIAVDADECYIEAEYKLLYELLYNLVDNAIKYNQENGIVSVKIKNKQLREDGCEYTLLSVKDTGIGIKEEHQEKIFERFFRVDKSRSKLTGGTGLGLSIVKHIAMKYNAIIEVDSKLNQGTIIQVYFPQSMTVSEN